jgi:low temperature requirement protein LtrA
VELFFDLVFVFAVTQITAILGHDLNGLGVVRGVIVFWLVWWAWTQFTWSLNEADTENPVIRLTTLVATALAFIMAMSLPLVGTEFGWLFPLAYLVVRIVGISLQWLLVEDDEGWSSAVRRWTVLSSLGLVAVAVAVVVVPEYRFLALGIAALFDVFAAARAGRGEWRLHSGHFAERHGLFVIIALGESLIAAGITASGQPPTPVLLGVALIAVIAACGLWWTYFGWVAGALEDSLARQPAARVGRTARDVYSFGHFPVVAGIIGFAVAIEQSVAHPLDPLPAPAVIALVVGVGLFVGGVALALLLGGCLVSRWRPIALGLLAVAAPFLTQLPAWAALVVVALLVVGLAIVDRPLGGLESEAGGPLDGSQTA